MNTCKKCGEKLVEGAKFCAKCGTPTENEIASFPSSINDRSVVKSKKKMIVLSGILLVVALILGGYYLMTSSGNITGRGIGISKKATKQNEKAVETKYVSYKNGDRFGLMDSNLNIIKEDIGMYAVVFNKEGVGVAYQNDHPALINTKGEIVADTDYVSLGLFNVNYADPFYSPRMQSKSGVMDFTTLEDPEDEDSYNTLRGLIDSKGNVILKPGDYVIEPFNGHRYTSFIKNNLTGIVSEEGEIVVEPDYAQAMVISDELIAVKKNHDSTKFDIIDLKGNVVKETSYNFIYPLYYLEGYFGVTNTLGKTGVIDSKLKEITPINSSSDTFISPDMKYIEFKEKEKKGISKLNGETVIEPIYDELSLPNEEGILAFQKGETYGLMTLDEEIIDDSFDSMLISIMGTNLFELSSYEDKNQSTAVLNGKGEEIAKENIFNTGRRFYPDNTYTLPHPKAENENPKGLSFLTVLNKDGKILSDKCTFLRDLGNNLFIQEDSHVMIVNKETGKIIKEKEL